MNNNIPPGAGLADECVICGKPKDAPQHRYTGANELIAAYCHTFSPRTQPPSGAVGEGEISVSELQKVVSRLRLPTNQYGGPTPAFDDYCAKIIETLVKERDGSREGMERARKGMRHFEDSYVQIKDKLTTAQRALSESKARAETMGVALRKLQKLLVSLKTITRGDSHAYDLVTESIDVARAALAPSPGEQT